jgi:TolA-binding protein
MKVLELHPDHLTDKELLGTLTPDEQRLLHTHRNQCASCMLEHQLRADFNAELGGLQETPSVRVLLENLVPAHMLQNAAANAANAANAAKGAATDAIAAPPSAAALESKAVRTSSNQANRAQKRRAIAACMFALTLCLSGLAAAKNGHRRQWIAESAREFAAFVTAGFEAPKRPAPAIPAKQAPAAHVAVLATRPEAPAPAVTTQEPVMDPVAEVPEPSGAPQTGAIAATRTRAPLQKPQAQPSESAAQWFERAHALRKTGAFGEAEQVYVGLIARYPQSAEAKVALAVSGRMQLDRGNPGMALERFSAYLRSGHAGLREEAMAGRALSLQRLQRTAEEREAWSALMTSFPHSGYAEMAKKSTQFP